MIDRVGTRVGAKLVDVDQVIERTHPARRGKGARYGGEVESGHASLNSNPPVRTAQSSHALPPRAFHVCSRQSQHFGTNAKNVTRYEGLSWAKWHA